MVGAILERVFDSAAAISFRKYRYSETYTIVQQLNLSVRVETKSPYRN